jgi:heptosyltransferase-2
MTDSARGKILVMRFSSLGDLILIIPLLAALRDGYPDSEIHLATKEAYRELFAGSPFVDRIHTLRELGLGALLRFRSGLTRERFHVIIDAHNVIRSNLLYHSLHAPRKIQLRKEQVKKALLIKKKRRGSGEHLHQSARYLELAEKLGLSVSEADPGFEIPTDADEKIADLLSGTGHAEKKLIALAPGARWETKCWPLEHYSRLADMIVDRDMEIVLIGGSDEVERSRELAARSKGSILDLTGRLSMLESAALLRRCEVLVTNDSAPLHMAETIGTPVVAIFGPTVQEFGYFPRLAESAILEIDLACRPCSRNGARPCELETKECLTAISPETAAREIDRIVGSRNDARQ